MSAPAHDRRPTTAEPPPTADSVLRTRMADLVYEVRTLRRRIAADRREIDTIVEQLERRGARLRASNHHRDRSQETRARPQ